MTGIIMVFKFSVASCVIGIASCKIIPFFMP